MCVCVYACVHVCVCVCVRAYIFFSMISRMEVYWYIGVNNYGTTQVYGLVSKIYSTCYMHGCIFLAAFDIHFTYNNFIKD